MASPTARTVFLKLHPSARTFAERREVLRVMERFGEVSMFKSNKYSPRTPTPNTFIVLFASASAAQEALNASPIRYRLISNPSSPPSSSDSSPTPSSPSLSSPEPPPAQEAQEHPYQLHAYPSTHNHTLSLSSPLLNPLHGPYTPISPQNSYIASSLSKNTPSSIMTPGLLDWETDSLYSRAAMDEFLSSPSQASHPKVEGENGDGEGFSRHDIEKFGGVVNGGEKGEGGRRAGFYHQQRQKKRAEKEIAGVMGGLRRFREEFLRREGEGALEEEWERSGGFAKMEET